MSVTRASPFFSRSLSRHRRVVRFPGRRRQGREEAEAAGLRNRRLARIAARVRRRWKREGNGRAAAGGLRALRRRQARPGRLVPVRGHHLARGAGGDPPGARGAPPLPAAVRHVLHGAGRRAPGSHRGGGLRAPAHGRLRPRRGGHLRREPRGPPAGQLHRGPRAAGPCHRHAGRADARAHLRSARTCGQPRRHGHPAGAEHGRGRPPEPAGRGRLRGDRAPAARGRGGILPAPGAEPDRQPRGAGQGPARRRRPQAGAVLLGGLRLARAAGRDRLRDAPHLRGHHVRARLGGGQLGPLRRLALAPAVRGHDAASCRRPTAWCTRWTPAASAATTACSAWRRRATRCAAPPAATRSI